MKYFKVTIINKVKISEDIDFHKAKLIKFKKKEHSELITLNALKLSNTILEGLNSFSISNHNFLS